MDLIAAENLQIDVSGGGMKKYPAKQHAQKVARHLGVSEGLVYLPGQRRIPVEDSDNYYPFRQRRPFYYFSGVNEPDCFITYDIKTDKSVLYVPQVSAKEAVWYARGSTVKEAKERYDIDDARWSFQLARDIQIYLDFHFNTPPNVFILHPGQAPANILSPTSYDTTSLESAIAASRVIKDDDEIAAVRHAMDISSFAHASVLHHITSLNSEAEIQGLFQDVCISSSAPLQAYDPIAGSGPNASILHYTANNRAFKGRGELLCLDAACEFECYAADITRTFPLSADGWASELAQDLYTLVDTMQETCIAALRPGVKFLDVFRLAQQMAVSGLIRLGVLKIKDTPDEVNEFIQSGGIYAFFPHGLGHHVGLDVHDVGPIDKQPSSVNEGEVFRKPEKPWTRNWHDINLKAPCRSDSVPLQAGMIITVEPGIYFNRYALDHLYLCHPEFAEMVDLDVLEKCIDIGGVRIEDDILITKDACINMTKAPKGERMLEIIREGAECDHGKDCPYRVRLTQRDETRAVQWARRGTKVTLWESDCAQRLRDLF